MAHGPDFTRKSTLARQHGSRSFQVSVLYEILRATTVPLLHVWQVKITMMRTRATQLEPYIEGRIKDIYEKCCLSLLKTILVLQSLLSNFINVWQWWFCTVLSVMWKYDIKFVSVSIQGYKVMMHKNCKTVFHYMLVLVEILMPRILRCHWEETGNNIHSKTG